MRDAPEKVVILGGRGMLGADLAAECERQSIHAAILDLPEFDITDEQQLSRAVEGAEAVVNCAAYTNVDGAESETERAYQVNAEAVGRLGALAAKHGIWVLHISTDFVFDGRGDKPYVETDAPNPISAYGRTKLASEKLLIESRCRYCIMRLEWTYGMHGNNFIKKLLKRAKDRHQLTVVDDQYGSPTATTEAAKVIVRLLQLRAEGIYHFAAVGFASRFEIARFVLEKMQLPVELVPCKTSGFKSPAARPLNSRFDCAKIQALLAEPITPWQVPLEQFLRRL